MPNTEIIYGTNCRLPELPPHKQILNWNKPKEEQMWVREELPEFFDKVQYTKAGDLILTEEQEEFAIRELQRCKKGLWIYINGNPYYITKKYYFYLQWWTLEDGSRPEYRDTDRRYFTFWSIGKMCRGVSELSEVKSAVRVRLPKQHQTLSTRQYFLKILTAVLYLSLTRMGVLLLRRWSPMGTDSFQLS